MQKNVSLMLSVSELCGHFLGNYAPQGFGAWDRELHVPEVRLRAKELNANILLSVSRAMNGNDSALHRLRRMIVYQKQRLPHAHDFFEMKERAVSVDGLRDGLRAEAFAGVRFSMDCQRDRQSHPQCAAPLFDAKVKQGHFFINLKSDFRALQLTQPVSLRRRLPAATC